MTTENRHVAPDAAFAAPVIALRVAAVATVAVLAWQFVSATGLLTADGIGGHAIGAIVLHVVSGLAAVDAIWLRVTRGGPMWPPVLATVIFGLTFVQASLGDTAGLPLHIPGAMVLTTGSVWLAAWSFLRLP